MTVLPRLLLVAGLFASAPAFAAPVDAAPRLVIHTAGLDLASDTGAAALRMRISHAARAVCGVNGTDKRDLRQMAAERACMAVAMADAAPQVEVALAAARTGTAYAANTAHVATGS